MDLVDELDFIEAIAEGNPKNYQVFHHRQRIVEEMSNRGIANFERELDFTEQLIDGDQNDRALFRSIGTIGPESGPQHF
jgi:hypothetical protein